MRLHSLRLQAFGPFVAEQVIDFEPLGAGGLFLATADVCELRGRLAGGLGPALGPLCELLAELGGALCAHDENDSRSLGIDALVAE